MRRSFFLIPACLSVKSHSNLGWDVTLVGGQSRSNDLARLAISVSAAVIVSLVLPLGWAAPAWSEVSDAELITATLSFHPDTNLLALHNSAEVVQVPSNPTSAERLIDGSPRGGWQSAESFTSGQPLEILFRLPAAKVLASILIQPQSSLPGASMPQDLEILVAMNDEPSDFVSLGSYRLQREGAWQRLHFPSHKTVFLKLRIHSIHGSGPVGLGEVAAFAPGVDARAPRYYYEAAAVPPVAKEKSSFQETQTKSSPQPSAVDRPSNNQNTLSDFQHVMKIKRGDDVTVVIGSVTTAKDLETIKGLLSREPNVEFYVSINPSDKIHPRTIRVQTASSMKASGLDGVQVRSRKEGELILLGKVASKREEELALSIAYVQPGIATVVNLLKISK